VEISIMPFTIKRKRKRKIKDTTIASPLPWKFKAWPWVTMARDA
jgi:hypothetical protein